jgi:ribonuclease VapC
VIIDSSVLVALVMREDGSEDLIRKMREGLQVGVAAPSLVESALVLSRRLGGNPGPLLFELLDELGVDIIAFAPEHAGAAIEAFLRYGKGRHPAALNFGDCLVYAVAKTTGEPLLYLGNDFSRTDLVTA